MRGPVVTIENRRVYEKNYGPDCSFGLPDFEKFFKKKMKAGKRATPIAIVFYLTYYN